MMESTDFLLSAVVLIESLVALLLIFIMLRQRSDIRLLLKALDDRRSHSDPAARSLIELLADVANASALGGSNIHMLAKRLDRILLSDRGEGRTIKDDFRTMADLGQAGLTRCLEERYPDLTPAEKALCAMLMAGLEPASISKICRYEHEQTFYNRRKDLRKKLGLEHGESLERFLEGLSEELRREDDAFFLKMRRRYRF